MLRIVIFAVVMTLGVTGQSFSSDSNNPLGGLFKKLEKDLKKAGDQLKNLNKGTLKSPTNSSNKSNSSNSNFSTSKESSAALGSAKVGSPKASNFAGDISGNPVILKACVPGLNEFNSIKRPAPNVSKVLSDFGMGRAKLEEALANSSSSGAPYVLDLSYYDGAFDDRAVDAIYRQFINSVNGSAKLELLGELASAMNSSGFSKSAKLQSRDAMAAYGIIHVYMSGNGGNKGLGDQLIMEAAKKGQIIAPYIIGMRFFKGYGKPVDLTAGATWIIKSRKALYEKKQKNTALKASSVMIEASDRLYKMVSAHWFELGLDPRYPRRDQVVEQMAIYQELLAEHEQTYGSQAASSSISSVSDEDVKTIALMNLAILEQAQRLLGDTKNADITKQMAEKFRADAVSDASFGAVIQFMGETNNIIAELSKTADVSQKQALVNLIVKLEDHISQEDNLLREMSTNVIFSGLSAGDVQRAGDILPTVGYMKKSACKAWSNLIVAAKRVDAPVPENREVKPVAAKKWLKRRT